jgi:hypothetical protein
MIAIENGGFVDQRAQATMFHRYDIPDCD